jgi:hypothetical membrane protein
MEVRQGGAGHVLDRHPVIATLAAAGIAGPIIFGVVGLVQSVLRQDHNLVAHPISALAAGPSGWVQNVNFLLFGLLMIAYAVGLHLGVRPSRWGVVGVAFLVLSGIGLVWGGVFPATDATGAFDETRVLHIPGFIMTFLGGGIGLIVMSRRMARHEVAEYSYLRARERHSHAGTDFGGRRPSATARGTASRVVWPVSVGTARSVVPLHDHPCAQTAASGESSRCAALSDHYGELILA